MKKYTFYWNDGFREVLEGYLPADALATAGYRLPEAAMRMIDYWEFGDDRKYVWNREECRWDKV